MGCTDRSLGLLLALTLAGPAMGDTIRVPGDLGDIQGALDAAKAGDTVLVAPGEYVITEPLSFNRLHDPANPEGAPLRDLSLVSEAGPAATVLRMGVPTDSARASVLVFEKGETDVSLVDGFTISGGAGILIGNQAAGGGIFVSRSSPTFRNCVIRENGTFLRGIGGGLYCQHSRSLLEDCVLEANFAEERGGGLEARDAQPILMRCLVLGNWTRGLGGGIYSSTSSTPQIYRSVLAGNAAPYAGALQANSRIIVDHCTFTANSAVHEEGGASCQMTTGQAHISHCIIWKNEPTNLPPSPGYCHPTRSLTDVDPHFVRDPVVDPIRLKKALVAGEERDLPDFFVTEGDYDLRATSLAIDRGDPDFPKDADGTRTDLGAFEFFQESRRPPGTVTVDPSGRGDFTSIQEALDAALDGDEIIVKPGLYELKEPIDYRNRIVSLRSEAGPLATTITRSPPPSDPRTGSVCIFRSFEGPEVVLDGFTLMGGNAERGGGISVMSSSPTIRNCRIVGNRADSGGGVALGHRGSLVDCTVTGNFARTGGGVYAESDTVFTRCRIIGNIAETAGGIHAQGSTVLTRCFLAENRAQWHGAGAFASDSRLVECTASGNVAAIESGGVTLGAGSVLTSCILWNNAPRSTPIASTVTWSCVEGDGVWPGTGNIHQDPLFAGWAGPPTVHVDPASGAPGDGSPATPYRRIEDALEGYSLLLAAGSPCLAAGENGRNMGADDGAGIEPGGPRRLLRLAAGSFELGNASLAHLVSIEGIGADETILEGPVLGLRSSSFIDNVTVTASTGSPFVALAGERSRIRRSTIRSRSDAPGVHSRTGSSLLLEDCRMTGCAGGALLCEGSSLEMERCLISRNGSAAPAHPKAISLVHTTAVVKDSEVSDNLALALSMDSSRVTLLSTRVADNGEAGLVASKSVLEVSDCVFQRTWGLELADSDARLLGTSILGSTSTGLMARTSSVRIEGCTIAGNDSMELGGGVHAMAGEVSILNTIVAGNFARRRGGGLAFEWLGRQAGRHSIFNSTIHGNGVGPGALSDTMTSAIHCTVPVSLMNCIVSENEVNPVQFTDIRTCLLDADPLFARPGRFNFELFTRLVVLETEMAYPDFIIDLGDYHLMPGSPALDSGTFEGAPSADLEGNPRPCGPAVDMGAFESTRCSGERERFRRGDPSADGAFSLTDAILILLHLFQAGPPPACMKTADTNDTGTVDLTDAVHLLLHLFLGGTAPPEPFSSCGPDPTLDLLTCDDPGSC